MKKTNKETRFEKLKAFLKWLFTPVPEAYDFRYRGWYPMV